MSTFRFPRAFFGCYVHQMSAYLLKKGKPNLPFPIFSEFVIWCSVSSFLPLATIYNVTVFCSSLYYFFVVVTESNLFLLLSKIASICVCASSRSGTSGDRRHMSTCCEPESLRWHSYHIFSEKEHVATKTRFRSFVQLCTCARALKTAIVLPK